MLSNRPLQDTRADVERFVGRRSELERLARGVSAGWNILVLGPSGSGVSSLLAAVRYGLGPDRSTTSVVVRAAGVGHVAELIESIAAALSGERPRDVRRDADAVLDGLDRLARAAGDGDRRVVFVDDLKGGELAWGLFGRYRDVLWELPLRFVVGGDSAQREQYLRPPADAFFEAVETIGPLNGDEAVAMLVGELTGHEAAGELPADVSVTEFAQDVVAATYDLLPRQIVDTARRALQRQVRPLDLRHVEADLESRAAASVGRSAAMLVAEMRSLGPVSASDPRLLERLGWTRSRAAQVFRSLALAGLVTYSDRVDGPGRPHRVYRLVDPATVSGV